MNTRLWPSELTLCSLTCLEAFTSWQMIAVIIIMVTVHCNNLQDYTVSQPRRLQSEHKLSSHFHSIEMP